MTLHQHCEWVSSIPTPVELASVQGWLITGQCDFLSLFPMVSLVSTPLLWIGLAGVHFPPALSHRVSITHSHTGGLLTDSWEVASNHDLQLGTQPQENHGHRIKHIINPRLLPRSSQVWKGANPEDVPEGVLSDEEQLTLRNLWAEVCCRAVFSPTGRTIRRLSLLELLGAFDLGRNLLPANLDGDQEAKSRETPFVLTPPGNVVVEALNRWEAGRQLFKYNDDAGPILPSRGFEEMGGMYEPVHKESMLDPTLESVKSDDAQTPVHLWDERIWARIEIDRTSLEVYRQTTGGQCPLQVIREFGLRYWRRQVLCSLLSYLQETFGAEWYLNPASARDREVGADCVWRAAEATWWEWTQGSTLFFWRWPRASRRLARDGHPLWVQDRLPAYQVPQRREIDPSIRTKVAKKLQTVRSRR
jgi:hypothetical protein